ncbi:DUF1826 domain-containing protein [Kiloniella sp. b19]|uniref:DUF1826 domain-containing protein n=1 Tax=Kiloniella sp. GXU_MW_B19 TaxID=3141326 RepID=UPI0031D18C93
MSVFRTKRMEALKDFPGYTDQLGLAERTAPEKASAFFQELMKEPFRVSGMVHRESGRDDIRNILEDNIPASLQRDSFYEEWLTDMAEVSRLFCDIQGTDSTGFWLGSKRGCRRYHIDNVALRMLVTYAGKGTEWLPDEAADRQAFSRREPNEKIVKDQSALQFMNQWDVALFRGGPEGLFHRTPDAALNEPSILMRLDHPSFWDRVRQAEQQKQVDPVPC